MCRDGRPEQTKFKGFLGESRGDIAMKLAKLMLFASPLLVLASAADYKITLHQKSVLGGTELKPGDYKVEVNGDKVRIYNKKQSAEAPVKMENGGEKFNNTVVRYSTAQGQPKLIEIRLGGTSTRLTFDN